MLGLLVEEESFSCGGEHGISTKEDPAHSVDHWAAVLTNPHSRK